MDLPINKTNTFNEQKYMKAYGYIRKVKILEIQTRKQGFSMMTIYQKILSKNKIIQNYQRLFLFGDHTNMEEDYENLTQLSLVHMFALSGMHISVLVKVLLYLFEKVFSKKLSTLFTKGIILLYIYSIPINLSLMRAGYMYVLQDEENSLSSLDLLSLLAYIQLVINPYLIFHLSFQFSYFVYLFVLLSNGKKYQSLILYLSSIPIILLHSGSIHLLSFLFSYLLMDTIPYFYVLTLLSILFPFINPLLLTVIQLFQQFIHFYSTNSLQLIIGSSNLLFIGIYYYLLIKMMFLLEHKQSIRRTLLCLTSLMITFSFYCKYTLFTEVVMLDVDQGDCFLVRLPFNQGNYLIDTGGNRNYDIAKNRIIPYLKRKGIDHLDKVFISHNDYDHSGALESLTKNFNVYEVVRKKFKEFQIGNVKFECLKTGKVYDNENDNSMIISLNIGKHRFLFTGDISQKVELDLIKRYPYLKVDYLKIGHHGSKYSSSYTFLSQIKPKVALVSVGANNQYRHPHEEVMRRLENMSIAYLRTDKHGYVEIKEMLGKLFVFY